MSKEVELSVIITLSDEITSKEQIAVIVENALIGLSRQAQETGEGLVGDNFEGYTEGIEVSASDFTQTWDVNSNKITTL